MNPIHSSLFRTVTVAAALSSATFLAAQQSQPAGQHNQPAAQPGQSAGQLDGSTDSRPAYGQQAGARANMNAKLSRSDRNFLEEAAKSGVKEVQISQAVVGKLSNPELRNFAQMMVTDHTAANAELKQIAARKGVALPEQDFDAMNKWSDKDADDVAKDYVEQMEDDHEDAIDLFEKAAKSDDADIAAFAQKTLPKLRQHQNQLKSQLKPAIDR